MQETPGEEDGHAGGEGTEDGTEYVDGQSEEQRGFTAVLVGDGTVDDLTEGDAEHEHREGGLGGAGGDVQITGNGGEPGKVQVDAEGHEGLQSAEDQGEQRRAEREGRAGGQAHGWVLQG